MRELTMTGKTVEEATEKALEELGLSEDEVTVEVVELPQRGGLFKKSVPAKVKVTVDGEENEIAKPTALPKAEKAPVVAPAVPTAKPAAPAQEKPQPKTAEKGSYKDEPLRCIPADITGNEKALAAVAYITELCTHLGASNLVITAVTQGETLILKVDGDGVGGLIGHRGEVMESLSYLASLVANRTGGDYLRIGLDINNYRAKREENLTILGKRIAEKVAKGGRSQTLEPMNPYERRIIHSAVSEVENVKSESMGEGANRRVVVSCTGENAKEDRPFRQAGRGPRPGGDRPGAPRAGGDRPAFNAPNRGPRAPRPAGGDDYRPRTSTPEREFADRPRDLDAAPIVPKRTETINDGADMPLYGKIEL